MIQFDINAGTHFDGREIGISNHAAEAAVEDFRIPETEARDWIKSQLRKAQYIGEMYGDNGVKVRLFGYQRIAFIVARDADVVITVYPRHKVDPVLRNPIEKIVQDAVAAAEARIAAAEQAASTVIAGFEAGKARAEMMKAEATDPALLEGLDAWIRDLEDMIANENDHVDVVRQDHARLLKGVVAYV